MCLSNMNKRKLNFITIDDKGYSRSWNYYSGAKKLGENVEFFKINHKHLFKSFLKLRTKLDPQDIYIVMSPSHYLVLFVRIFLGKNIVLDSGWSLFEGTVISRKKNGLLMNNLLKIYIIDFIAAHFAQKIILESESQKKYYSSLFLIRKSKCFTLFTGVDEDAFTKIASNSLPPDYFNNSKIVLFRGKYNIESGIDTLAEASMLLKDKMITFWVFCPGLPEKFVFSKNTFVQRESINSKKELASIYDAAAVTLGQMSNHPRLSRTIPHKAFESAFLGKPYISARAAGISELFKDKSEILFFEPANSKDLANKILELIENPEKLKYMSKAIRKKYDSYCSQYVLAKKFISIIESKQSAI